MEKLALYGVLRTKHDHHHSTYDTSTLSHLHFLRVITAINA